MASKHAPYLLVVLLYGNTAAVASPQLADHGSQCAHAVESEGGNDSENETTEMCGAENGTEAMRSEVVEAATHYRIAGGI
eukprot:CAMPEP_0179064310 /NCGR_PEP_ID=MMETSP0796-20121207/27884_1 /TAXON_ID=73915 /ORGANISM="Pyrodinium bahamense, Strain pbaha01" /LENGTH=79 /DNA_ID=CAMNT_0020761257 /DNA_START=30 /DNA_END=266 /DNA_ORIENTATION=-